jgi:4-amino-4-deoxy-L-arabinose transferase-like glycosyltransferase
LVGLGLLVALAAALALLWRGVDGRRGRGDVALAALAALALGTVWAGLTPAFHETDEPAHFAYVQAVAELGHPPRQLVDDGLLSDELACWFDGLAVQRVRFFPAERPPWSETVRQDLDARCATASPRYDGAQYHAVQPPGYYLLAAVAYEAGSGAALPMRLLLARLVSVLLTALTVALTYLLVRELVPASRWAARAGALAVALQPIFLFNAAGVNPDALVVALAAGVALVLARAWRRGLTTRRALLLGGLVGAGLWTKANFLALLPAVVLAAALLWWYGGPSAQRRTRALRLAGGAGVAVAALGLLAVLYATVWDRAFTYRQRSLGGEGGSLGRLVSHVWQFFLPPLPFMDNLPGAPPVWSGLLRGISGRLGWWDDFGLAGGWMALVLLGAVAIAAGAAVYVVPRARRRPGPALAVAACVALFLAMLVYADYQFSLSMGTTAFEGRYVFPLIPLWGVVVGCCVAAAPPRWRPSLAGLLAVTFLAHTLLALAAMTGRYYL